MLRLPSSANAKPGKLPFAVKNGYFALLTANRKENPG